LSRQPRLGLIAYEYPPLIGGMATYGRALAQHMHCCGYDVHIFANEKSQPEPPFHVHPILTTDLARDLPRLARYEMDLWHSINFGYAPLSALKRPFVLTVHGTDFLTPWVRYKMDRLPMLWRTARLFEKRTARRAVNMPALRCVDQVITCSRFSAKMFRREYPSVGQIKVIPNGVDDAFLQSVDSRHIDIKRHPRRILTVCKLDTANRRKNIDGVIKAMALIGRHLNLQYWIVGDGPEKPALEKLAEEFGVSDHVHFLGRISDEQLRQAYASSSLFVMVPKPRPGDIEGFGIVYLEAAACGTPSLAGRYGGAPDAIDNGVSGFFAEDSGPVAIADALVKYFTGQVNFYESEVRLHAANFAWPKVLKNVEEIYQRLLPKSLQPISVRATDQTRSKINIKNQPSKNTNEDDWHLWIKDTPEVSASGRGGRVLIVSYAFPPIGGSGVQRPAKLAKYLSEFGWEAEVLTAAHHRFPWYDESLAADIPDNVHVHRVSGYEPACLASSIASLVQPKPGTQTRDIQSAGNNGPSRRGGRLAQRIEDGIYWRLAKQADRLGMGNGEQLWITPAVQAALRRHRRNPFDVVISTGPPHFVHQVGLRVARKAVLPWVADVRDPLVSDFDRTPQSRTLADRMRRLEQAIVRHAAKIITTCPAFAADLLTRYPQRSPDDVYAITNGFDRDDLREMTPTDINREDSNTICDFVAAGSFYGRREIRRIIEPIQQVLDKHPEWQGRIRLTIAGTIDAHQRRYWEQHKPEWLRLTGYVDQASALQFIVNSDCAIVVVPECQHGRMSIPGKTFELLAIPTHLLALVPPGCDTEKIVADAGASTVTTFENTASVAAAIERIVDHHQNGHLNVQRQWNAIDVYDRRMIAAQFADCLSAACNRMDERISESEPEKEDSTVTEHPQLRLVTCEETVDVA